MIIEDLIEFLKTGQLNHFPFGIEKERVISLLGETDERIDNLESSILKYDRTEFFFYHNKSGLKFLEGIMIQPIPVPADKGKLNMNYHWLNKKLNYLNAKKKLKLENIGFTETLPIDEKALGLKTEGQVELLFFKEDNKICKVGSFVRHEELSKEINGG